MYLALWSAAVIQLLGWKSNIRGTLNEEQDERSSPSEQLAGDASKETCLTPAGDHSESRKRRRKEDVSTPEKQQGGATKFANTASTSPRRLEEATDKRSGGSGLVDEAKWEKQVALCLLTLSASALISAKAATLGHQAGQQSAAGGQAHQPGFFFCGSIALWFTCLLTTVFILCLTAFLPASPGLVIYARRMNIFVVGVAVLGVAFWIVP